MKKNENIIEKTKAEMEEIIFLLLYLATIGMKINNNSKEYGILNGRKNKRKFRIKATHRRRNSVFLILILLIASFLPRKWCIKLRYAEVFNN